MKDLGVFTNRPNVYGAVYRFEGQVSFFDGRTGPCYRCLFHKPPRRVKSLAVLKLGFLA